MSATDGGDPVTRLLQLLTPTELLGMVTMAEAERLSTLSEDTLRREHSDKVHKLSKRRSGMRRVDALMLGGHGRGVER
jgi:hypothetical protein